MVFGETARVVGTEGGRHIIAVQQGVVHAGNQRVQTGFRDARLRGIGAGAIAQVILFQRFVGEMVGAQVTVGGFRSLSRKACQCVQIVDAAEVACVGGCVFLLPDVGLPVARAADALRGQSQRGVCSREIVLRQLFAAESHGGFQRQVANAIAGPHVRKQIVVHVLGHALTEVVHRVRGMVANGKVGIFVGVLEVVGAVLIINADHRRHQQRIDKAVGDAGRIGRRVEYLLLGGGQTLLH